jgi:hypothetical protein
LGVFKAVSILLQGLCFTYVHRLSKTPAYTGNRRCSLRKTSRTGRAGKNDLLLLLDDA